MIPDFESGFESGFNVYPKKNTGIPFRLAALRIKLATLRHWHWHCHWHRHREKRIFPHLLLAQVRGLLCNVSDPVSGWSWTQGLYLRAQNWGWYFLSYKCWQGWGSGALVAQNGALEGHGRSEWRRGGSKWSCGGSVDQWSQIRITLIRSRI